MIYLMYFVIRSVQASLVHLAANTDYNEVSWALSDQPKTRKNTK